MSNLDIARWQFAITTVYHFIFVPLTIGMAFMVAILQTAWVRTGKEKYLQATTFFGKILLINFAMGVVTGIVQEFQFGMNWSSYSRFVGDVFGAPLAMEGLLAFFLESTFLGLWIFGWNRLSRGLHLATIWVAAIGTLLSAYFILAANAWMQHPVGYQINELRGRAELTDIGAVLTQNTAVSAFVHTIPAAFMVSGGVMMAVAAWLWSRGRALEMAKSTFAFGGWTVLVASVVVILSGDYTARIMTEQQPMKMAAAEALYETSAPAPFSLFTVGTLDGSRPVFQVEVPQLLSFMATGDPSAAVAGINDLQAAYVEQFGPGDYRPNIPLAYWTFRLMIGLGAVAALLAGLGLLLTRRGRFPRARWFIPAMIALPLLPLAANSIGWIFTETARQPWVVWGLMTTADGVSPTVGAGTVLTTLIGFTLLYGVLAVVELGLILRVVRVGPPTPTGQSPYLAEAPEASERPLTFSY